MADAVTQALGSCARCASGAASRSSRRSTSSSPTARRWSRRATCSTTAGIPRTSSFFAGEREHDFTTLWTTQSADGRSVTVASEPLTGDHTDWLEVPEYALLKFSPGEDGIAVEHRELVL